MRNKTVGSFKKRSSKQGRPPALLPRRELGNKVGHQQVYWSHPGKFGQSSRSCRMCSTRHRLIRKHGLNMCRQCFHPYAKDAGFIKLD
ncbi:small ribosomal subunit protein uS14-like [Tenrec ecaudatus]|uniref:small ribosomal subunit protein uS14-like n=1 Tax=Tenrec ecaudatus TaxID=94439 RepID=UPI003F59A081